MGASYGKLMMWFFIVSDALTFSGFLCFLFKFIETWPLADECHLPFMHGVSVQCITCCMTLF
jgi:cytochrome c oxidase subunit 3